MAAFERIARMEQTAIPAEILNSAPIGQVVAGNRINWQEVKDPRSLLIAWRQLMRSDGHSREDCVQWLQKRPTDYQPKRQEARQNRQDRRPNNRIFNIDADEEELKASDDQIFDGETSAQMNTVRTRGTTAPRNTSNLKKTTGTVKILHRPSVPKPRKRRSKRREATQVR